MKISAEELTIHTIELELVNTELVELVREFGELREEWFQMMRLTNDDLLLTAFREQYPKIMELWEGLCS